MFEQLTAFSQQLAKTLAHPDFFFSKSRI